jgi:hypothetical protein
VVGAVRCDGEVERRPPRFRATCYRAANWISLGLTTGRGNKAPTKKPRMAVKEILGYPLTRRFRELLSELV